MDVREIRFADYSAKINLTRGANCISLRHEGFNATILREPTSNELDNPFLYGMPLLFPVNRISGGSFDFEGRTYTFPINEERTGCHLHGTLHETPFTLLSHTENSLSAIYRAERGEYLGFIHGFEIKIEYTLSSDGLAINTEVTNLSDENMPCLIGFHTTFNALPTNGSNDSRVFVEICREYERNMHNYLPTGNTPPPDAVTAALKDGSFDPLSMPISRHYKSSGGNMSITSGDIQVLYENSDNLPFRLIYNGQADGYICLEPQTSLANSPNSPISRDEAGFTYVKPYGTHKFTSKISIKNTCKGIKE